MKKRFKCCVWVWLVIFVSCSREDTQIPSTNKSNNITNKIAVQNKVAKQNKVDKLTTTNVIQDDSIDINKVNEETKKYDKLFDLLTTGGINNSNLTDAEKELRLKAYDAMNKSINKTNFFALQYDEDFMSLTNRILTDAEIQLIIDNLDIPSLINKAGSLFLGYEMVRDFYASKKLLEHIIEVGNETERLRAKQKLAEFSSMPFIKNRDLIKAISLHKETLIMLENCSDQVSDFNHGLNFGWAIIGLAQCYNALEQPEKEKEVYEKLADYLKEKQKKPDDKIALSIAFAKNIVVYREKLPKTQKGLEQLAGKFEDIFNKISDKNNSPLAGNCTGIAKELRRKAKLLNVENFN